MICLKPSSWLASQKVDKNVQLHGRSPYGERGLKLISKTQMTDIAASLSLRRAWIEMIMSRLWTRSNSSRSPYGERGLKFYLSGTRPHQIKSLSLRRAWIEIPWPVTAFIRIRSLSLRRAWIEIITIAVLTRTGNVALLTESVD